MIRGLALCVLVVLFGSSQAEDYPSDYIDNSDILHCYSTFGGVVIAHTNWTAPEYNPSLINNNTYLGAPPATGWVWDWDSEYLEFDDGDYDAWDGAHYLYLQDPMTGDSVYSNSLQVTCGTKASATAYSTVDSVNTTVITRHLYAPYMYNFVRVVDVFYNPSNVTQVLNISWFTNLGSDSDSFFEMAVYNATQGRALVSTDNYGFNNGGDPPVSENLYGPGANLVPRIVFNQYDDNVYTYYNNVEIPAGAQIALMAFYSQNLNVSNAIETALIIDSTPALALLDMPVSWATVQNWGLSCGQFSLSISYDNSCPGNVTVSLAVPEAANFNTEPTFTVSIGSDFVAVQNGTISLPQGIYSVIATVGTTGCSFEKQLIVQESVLSATQTAAFCFGQQASVLPTLSTGLGSQNDTFVFRAVTGATYNTLTGTAIYLPSGAYNLTVNTCLLAATIVVPESPSDIVAAIQYVNGTSSASVLVTGGTSPYTYHWSSSDSRTNEAPVLPAGVVSVLVNDANNCTKVVNFTVYIAPSTTTTASAVTVSSSSSSSSASTTHQPDSTAAATSSSGTTASSAGDSTTTSARDSTTASAGSITTASAGDSTTASAGDSTTASAGDSTTASAGDSTTAGPADTTASPATTASAGDSTTAGPADTTASAGGDTTANPATTTASAATATGEHTTATPTTTAAAASSGTTHSSTTSVPAGTTRSASTTSEQSSATMLTVSLALLAAVVILL